MIAICLALVLASCKDKSLPLPETAEGMRGELGIDKNINEEVIDEYLGRDDAVYFDMRMLKDEANYEAIGGDSYLSGFVKGFEVVPYPYLCNVEGLPEAVGMSYAGPTLFSTDETEGYIANYAESMDILESLFPKDKYIFLMCGGGGYAGMTKAMLAALGWNPDKIYNVGGYWYYTGKNNVEVKYQKDGQDYYDFSKVDYHLIDFDTLHPLRDVQEKEDDIDVDKQIEKTGFIELESLEDLEKLEQEKKTFALLVYKAGCTSCASFIPVVQEFVEGNDIVMHSISLTKLWDRDNSVKERTQYTPSMFIYKDGEVVAFLDPQSDDDLPYYKSTEALSEWFSRYLDVNIIKTDTINEVGDCETACKLGD